MSRERERNVESTTGHTFKRVKNLFFFRKLNAEKRIGNRIEHYRRKKNLRPNEIFVRYRFENAEKKMV